MNNYKYGARNFFSMVFATSLIGCACNPSSAENTASVSETKKTLAPSITIRPAVTTPLSSTLPPDDLYIRLKTDPPPMPESVTFNTPSFIQNLKKSIGEYFWDRKQTISVALTGTIGEQTFGKRSIVLIDTSNLENPVYSDHYLTPYFRTGNQLVLQWDRSYKESVDSNLTSALVFAFQELTAIYAPNGVIFQTISHTENMDKKIQKVDDAINRTFSADNIHHDAAMLVDPSKQRGYEIYFNNDEKPSAVVNFEYRESLISPSGNAKDIPFRPEEIKAKTSSDGSSISVLIEGTNGQSPIFQSFNKNTVDGYGEFCRKSATMLVSKGYNFVDRSAILYSYLKKSTWENTPALRGTFDVCTDTIAEGIKSIGNANISIRTLDDLTAESKAGRQQALAKLNSNQDSFWKLLSPKFTAPSNEYLYSIASDNVTLSSIKYDLQLTDSLLLKAGTPISLSIEELHDVLAATQFKYDKDRAIKEGRIDDACYSIANLPSSSFRALCFYPKNGTSGRPLTMEFDFTGNFSTDADAENPKLNAIKFFPTASSS